MQSIILLKFHETCNENQVFVLNKNHFICCICHEKEVHIKVFSAHE